jgi:hypothetical protein
MHVRLGRRHEYDDDEWARLGPIHCWSCGERTRKTVWVEIDGVNGKGYCPRCTGRLAAEAETVKRPSD